MNTELLAKYHQAIEEMGRLKELQTKLPSGYIRTKWISGRPYYYLQFREGKSVKSRYVKADELPDLSKKLEEKKANETELKRYRREIDTYERILGVILQGEYFAPPAHKKEAPLSQRS